MRPLLSSRIMERTICILLAAGVSYGLILSPENEMTPYAITESSVYHLEADLYKVGNTLFSDGSAIKTTDGKTTSLIAGSALSSGYLNGIGAITRFDHIYGFMQLSPSQVLLADSFNHCLRYVERTTNETTDYAGRCTSGGDRDGDYSLLYYPTSVFFDIKNRNRVIIAERLGLRSLYLNTNSLSTIWAWKRYIYNAFQQKSTGNVYIASINLIGYYSFDSDTWTTLSADSLDYRNVKFFDEHILLLSEHIFNRLEVLNLKTNTSSYICSGIQGHESGNLTSCRLYYPWGQLILNNTLYIGEYQRIRTVQGDISKTSPTTPPLTSPTMYTISIAQVSSAESITKTSPSTSQIVLISTGIAVVLCTL